jgi:hypothetical protein
MLLNIQVKGLLSKNVAPLNMLTTKIERMEKIRKNQLLKRIFLSNFAID